MANLLYKGKGILFKKMDNSLSVEAYACANDYETNSNEIHALGRDVGDFSTEIHTLTDALKIQ